MEKKANERTSRGRRQALRRIGDAGLVVSASALTGCGEAESGFATNGSAEGESVALKDAPLTHTFTPTYDDIPNPERGLAGWGFDLMEGSDSWLGSVVFPGEATAGRRLVRCQTILADYGYLTNRTISAGHLSNLSQGFSSP